MKTRLGHILIPVGLGLSLGALDAAFGIAGWASGASPWKPYLAPVAATTVAFALAFLVLWGACAPFWKRAEGRGLAVAQAVAAFLATAWFAVVSELARSSWLSLPRLALPLGLGIPIALVVYWLTQRAHLRAGEEAPGSRAAHFWLAAPLVVCEVAVFLGVLRFVCGPSPVARVAAVALLSVAITVTWRSGGTVAGGRVAALTQLGLLVGIVALPWVDLSGGAGPSRSGSPSARRSVPRVILIVVDTLRADSLSCYAEGGNATPNVQALASDSVVFDRARAPASWTLPSMCSLMTGVGPDVHLAQRPQAVLPDTVSTIAEHMRDAGYRTAAFGENTHLKVRSRLNRGFEDYSFYPRFRPEPPFGTRLLGFAQPERTWSHLDAQKLNHLATGWIDDHADEDFFLWLHYFDPHTPYAPPREFLPKGPPPEGLGPTNGWFQGIREGTLTPTAEGREWIRETYEAEVRYFDDQLGHLVETLKARGLYDDALIVLTSDHGEEFWEHGGFEHGHQMYDELLRVPLMVKLPGAALKTRVSEDVSTEGVAPTILETCGLSYDAKHLSAPTLLLADPPRVSVQPRPQSCVGQLYYEERTALVFRGHKYVRFVGSDREELYDLANDPGETTSLVETDPVMLQQARDLHEFWSSAEADLREHYGITDMQVGELDASSRAELQDLGYIGETPE